MLVHYDVDAICTCKIIQGLFKSDNITYTLVPVGGIAELKTAYEENSEEIKFVVLVNCGGTIDLVDILQPEEDVVFFVLDAHKPTDVCNVYSDSQVRFTINTFINFYGGSIYYWVCAISLLVIKYQLILIYKISCHIFSLHYCYSNYSKLFSHCFRQKRDYVRFNWKKYNSR